MYFVSTGRKLVIVESPAKAKTIGGYLGKDYDVEASVGHIRDIPTPSEMPAEIKKGPFGRFGVDVDKGFEAYYVVDSDKKKKVSELKRLLKDADELLLATDEDREGEAIAWHLLEVLKPKVPVKRMVFHEITKEAIQRAVNNTRDLDTRLVDAQETRRILDRLYGYEVSPVLWRKVKAGLSAGRVQSVATRLVVERERERMAFVRASYWDVEGDFTPGDEKSQFTARLTQVDGARVATGRDFGDDGTLKNATVAHLDEATARSIAESVQAAKVSVTGVQEKPYTRRPSAPFTTSTLQQEASRKLRLSSKNAMRVAQRLYENGYITYMRTDSTTLSESALTAARQQARDLYGAEYVPQAPRLYEKKVKNAQEAHEAIRPAGDRFRTPAQVAGELRGDEFALYELIWKRTVASQMADARGSTATVKLGATLEDGRTVEFSASGTVITFRGFLAAYEEGRDDDGGRGPKGDEERRLPKLSEGVALTVVRAEADGHETSPPPRYTEATLVKAMEEKGIGRPSTYASIMGTIQDRGYVGSRGNALIPTWLAFAVTRLLEEHFGSLVDYDFTASMEEDLDRIANGDEHRAEWLARFYFGDEAKTMEGLRHLVEDLGEIDAREISTIPIGDGIVVRVGRYGPYVEETSPEGVDLSTGEVAEGASGQPRRATITDDIAPDEMTPAKARELLEQSSDDGRVLGQDPETGRDIVAKAGRYGPYVTEVLDEETAALKGKAKVKPRTASLFKDMDLATVDLDTAMKLLSLPRVVGTDEEGVRDHGPERPLRALPQEGHRLPLVAVRAAALRHHARGGAGDLRPAQAARPRREHRPAQGARQRPGVRQPDGGQGRPVRCLRHRRRDQRDAAQGRRPRVDHARARCRAARREARQGPHDPQARHEEVGREEDRQEEHRQEDDGEEERRQEGLIVVVIGEGTRRELSHRLAVEQAERRLPSVAAGLVRGGALVWSDAVGTLDGRAGGTPADPGTQYRIGSITKTFVAVEVLRLRDEGRLELNDPIGAHLGDAPHGHVTVAQLLSHTSGLQAETAGPWWERVAGGSWADLVASQPRLLFRPGARFHYSNVGYAVLGELVGRLRGVPWHDAVEEGLLRPLGMARTTTRPQEPAAQGWGVHPLADVLHVEPEHDAGAMAPAGQFWSTVEDLSRWAAFAAGHTSGLLAPETLEEMRLPIAVNDLPGAAWTGAHGLGWQVWNVDGVRYAGHGGSMPGFLAGLRASAETGDGVVVLANATSGLRPSLAEDLLRLLAEREPVAPQPWSADGEQAATLDLVGEWYWGTAGYTLSVTREGRLVLGAPGVQRGSRFRPVEGGWIGLDGYFEGELLTAVHDEAGRVSHLDLGSFRFTRTPYDPAADIPGDVHPARWH